jgi:1-carboxybiuret hydrolase subunit AtzG-like
LPVPTIGPVAPGICRRCAAGIDSTRVRENVMTDTSAYIEAAAEALELKIAAEYRPGVAVYFDLATEMARLVQGLPLASADESGSVFVPVVAELGP